MGEGSGAFSPSIPPLIPGVEPRFYDSVAAGFAFIVFPGVVIPGSNLAANP
jgi:hypothetical protein